MKRFILAVLLLFMPAQALFTDSYSYNKGDVIHITINNLIPKPYRLYITNEKNIILEKEFIPNNQTYHFSYNISFLDPSGVWKISCNNKSKEIIVNNTRDSMYYLITFISPLNKSYLRTDSFNITINLTLGGSEINNAIVQSFDNLGKRINLINYNGLYTFPYHILPNETLGIKQIKVLALKDGKGGEGNINITILPARFTIKINPQLLSSYSIGSELPLNISVYYPNNSLAETNITALINNKLIKLNLINNSWVGKYKFSPQDNGLSFFVINATDKYGNSGVLSIKFNVSGLFYYYIKSNIHFIIISLIGAGLLIYYLRKKLINKLTTKSLKQKKKDLIDKKKRLQKDYFINKIISRKVYEKDAGKIDEQLSIINNKMRQFKK